MKITELESCPMWLKKSQTENADVEILDGKIYWYGGVWRGGDWHGGVWRGGVWHGGIWHGGDWRGGDWYGGDWYGGVWYGGVWHGGVWHGGDWRGGVWRGGVWRGGDWRGGVWHGGDWRDLTIDRLLFMAASIGIVFDETGHAIAYRSTIGGRGRFTAKFYQPEGEHYEDNLPPPGCGTCVRGIHVCSQAVALTYFDIDPAAQLWRVRFNRKDLLDCDGEKARIRGGFFEQIPWPFYSPTGPGDRL